MTPTLIPAPPPVAPPSFASCHTAPAACAGTPPDVGHADNIILDARQYKTACFAHDVLRLLATLRIASWAPCPALAPASLSIYKVSGSLTNAVFFISHVAAKTVLLRVYGPSSSSLVSRPRELHTLHILSSRYGIGPRVYGTFANGRVEQYFESEALTAEEMRDPQVSAWIGMRMAELHRVDLRTVVPAEPDGEPEGVRRVVRSWLGPAREVVRLAQTRGRAAAVAPLQLERFAEEWEAYWAWLVRWERTHGRSERVFSHNDTQYGNLLRLKTLRAGEPAHHKIIVVDFEYAAPNAAAYDIANHFHEWMADYHAERPHELRRARYPDVRARRSFYVAYLTQRRSAAGAAGAGSTSTTPSPPPPPPTETELDALEAAVEAWSPASHAMWALWGIVQARDEVGRGEAGEFDYLGYAASRMGLFRGSSCCN